MQPTAGGQQKIICTNACNAVKACPTFSLPLPQCPCLRDKVRTVSVPTGGEPSSERLAPLLSTLPLELRPDMEAFIRGAFQVSRWGVCRCG